MALTEVCPKCGARGVSSLAKAFAVWPFSARCKNCGEKLRVRMPYWQNVLIQLLSQAVFWTVLIVGIMSGAGVVIGFALGAVLALLIAVVPGRFAKLEVVSKTAADKGPDSI